MRDCVTACVCVCVCMYRAKHAYLQKALSCTFISKFNLSFLQSRPLYEFTEEETGLVSIEE